MGQSVSREALIDELNAIEERYDVTQWKLGDLHYWPVLKNVIFFSWHQQYERTIENKKRKQPSFVFKLYFKLKQFVSSTLKLCRFIAFYYLTPKKKTDILFAGTATYRVQFEGKFRNRYFDPIIQSNEALKYLFVEYSNYKKEQTYPNYNNFLRFNSISHPFYTKDNSTSISLHNNKEIIEVSDHFAQILHVSSFSIRKKLINRLKKIQNSARLFTKIFERCQPKAVFGLYYYGDEMYGMNLAASRMGITSIDMQHGGIGTMHPSYTGFKKLPHTGYAILPNYFWCWDDLTANAIKKKNNFHQNHLPIAGGNPWYVYALKNGIPKKFAVGTTKRVILYTLQYAHLNDYIIHSIKALNHSFDWYIRMHPRKQHEKPKIIEKLKQHDLMDCVNVDDATSFPLPMLMIQADVHLSKFSGSINEAYELGLPNVIIGETGFRQYSELINKGSMLYYNENDDYNSLVAAIEKAIKIKDTPFNHEEYAKSIQAHLNEILQKSGVNIDSTRFSLSLTSANE